MLYLRKTFDLEHPLEDADVALIGIPWDFSQTGYPTRYGPVLIREAIKLLVGNDTKTGFNIFNKMKFCDLGDIEVVPSNWKLTKTRITDTINYVFEANPNVFPVFLGGDHLITLGILESMKDDLTVVDFDAHRDLADTFLGEKYSHLTWARRLLELGHDIRQIGCRSWSEEENEMIEQVKDSLDGIKNPVYLTMDLDVFDPKEAPEVGTPEMNGMLFREFLEYLNKIPNIIGMDIVECADRKIGSQTANLAANVFKQVLIRRSL